MPLCVRPLCAAKGKAEDEQNAGEPYKFSVRTQTVPFSESPRAVLDALALLDSTVRDALPGLTTGFNE